MTVSAPDPVVDTLFIVGIGLIGSSLALAARSRALARNVILYDADSAVRSRARALQLGDVVDDLAPAGTADLIIICVPVGASGAVAAALKPHVKPGAIISDVGSTKASVVAQIAPHIPEGVHFVPAHPIAGTENSGPDAGFATLFTGRWAVITPLPASSPDAVATVKAFWKGCGAEVSEMTPGHHDMVLAITSHIPHLIAYNIVGTAAHLGEVTQSEVITYSAGGFRDFTRIAASDPNMWRDVFLHNREAVLEMLGRFNEDLSALTRAIRYSDGEALFDHFTRTRAIRRSILAAGQDTEAVDFGRHGTLKKEQ
ncbi:MAG: prephenate/arogenate dehydrogenase family protein [Hyphomicrobiales bacterium]|nr:prephenate/arogenate dehydrogenase family protein [Hyphomicrobiales bacterium]OQW81156.1 MAG: hypothetical protein BVN31_11910 [Proteobacteria bacterium ST_bin15]